KRALRAVLAVVARILVLDRDHAVIAGGAHGAEQGGPARIFMPLAHRGEVPRRSIRVAGWREMQDAVATDAVGMQQRVLAVHPANAVAQRLDHGQRVDALPPEVAGIEVEADIAADMGGERFEAGGAEDGDAGMHLQADHHLRRFSGQPVARLAPERAQLMLELPAEQPLVVGRGRPAGEYAERAAARTGGTTAHRDDALD